MIARSQKRFAWNTAHIEAGAAELLVLFDKCGFKTELPGANCGNVPTRARADYNDLKFFHDSFLSSAIAEKNRRRNLAVNLLIKTSPEAGVADAVQLSCFNSFFVIAAPDGS